MREKKSGNRRIEFVAKTVEQKQRYEEKRVEMQFKSISDMIRFALDELIEGNDMSSQEVIRLQEELKDRDDRIMELEATLTKKRRMHTSIFEMRTRSFGFKTMVQSMDSMQF